MVHDKHFTLEQANAMLEKIKPKIEQMAQLKKLLDDKNYDIYRHEYFGGVGPNGTGEFPLEMDELIDIIKEIASKGILIKGINNGILDFPAIRSNGEEVYLCWILGEERILFWHRIPDGFPGRTDIEEL